MTAPQDPNQAWTQPGNVPPGHWGAFPPPGPPPYGSGPPPGYQQFPQPYPPPYQHGHAQQAGPFVTARQTNPLAVASLVCSCLGIIPFVGFVGVILGIVFGVVAKGQIRRTGGIQEGRGLATAGIVIGSVLLALGILLVVLVIVIGAHAANCANNPGAAGCGTP